MSLLSLIALAPAHAADPLVLRDCSGSSETVGWRSRSAPARPQARPAPRPAPVAPGWGEVLMDEDAAASGPLQTARGAERSMFVSEPEPLPAPPPAPVPSFLDRSLDWGGSTWLSNDDSMSLASAQRVLWSVEQGRTVPATEVRPHELLNYFSFDTVQPTGRDTFEVTASGEVHGDRLSLALAVQGARPPRQPLDLTLVVDRSGSMRAEGRMDFVRRGLGTLTEQLDDGDRLDLVLFDDQVCTPVENFVVGRDDPAVLSRAFAQAQPRGGTDLDAGLREGYAVAGRKSGTHRRNRRVMLLTDALMNHGDVDPHTVSEIGERFDAEGIRLTGVGVGRDFDDEVLDRLTEKGRGAYVYLGSEAVVDRVFGSGFDSLVQTLAHDVRFQLHLPDELALERFYGEEASTHREDVQAIHYHAGTSQVFLQDLRIREGGLDPDGRIALDVSWRDAATGEPAARTFSVRVGEVLAADPHNVRKARALMGFSDLLLADGQGDCRAAWSPFAQRLHGLSDDAEIAYVERLGRQVCPGVPARLPEPTERVTLKVRLDSDQPVTAVHASCSEGPVRMTAGSSVARFEAEPGSCTVTLDGLVPLRTEVQVARVDTDVRCLVRGGRLRCD